MDIILHAGAHRTATTSFQAYLRAHGAALKPRGIGFWGPRRTRNGLLYDVVERPGSPGAARRAAGRLGVNLEKSRGLGLRHLVITDENMIGTARNCLRQQALYPAIGERMARLSSAAGGAVQITLQIRSLDHWWASVVAYLVPRGQSRPAPDAIAALAQGPRSWRAVITDLACACPDARIQVTPFECFADRPDLLLQVMTGEAALPSAETGRFLENRRPDTTALQAALEARGEDTGGLQQAPVPTRWSPFDEVQSARLRQAYEQDLAWLRAGADGLATLTETPQPSTGTEIRTRLPYDLKRG